VEVGLFAQGAVLGFAIAAAVGPIALLTIRRTLASGWPMGLASGLGVATADGLYGAVAAFGLTAISDALVGLAAPLGIAGGGALVIVGLRTALSPPATQAADASATRRGLVGAYLSILALTLTNPMTILLFAAMVASIGVMASAGDAALVATGFFAGSLAWWIALVALVAAFRRRITGRVLRAITIASGLAIAAFGAASVTAVVLGRA
jgi:threonine/homoserine/homoserine lactone efflux protein